ncbi:MAG TPA: hypothetical protein PK668_06885 [Myxococcota bacterium]|nr:hypothetical protein [Myxococcota bacterium]HRY92431.1 hypothetical protein [Myxococcota bacterium]HSA22768.1 hypothetical protein [Myxococcota bacterium]
MQPPDSPDAPRFAPPLSGAPSREELRARLRALALSEPPRELAVGACCYEVASNDETEDHLCPTCGARTTYPRFTVEFVREARARLREVRGLRVELDERGFCGRCSRGEPDRRLDLVLHLPGETAPRRVADVQPRDLVLLAEFLSGLAKHRDGHDESPLKDHLPRLRQLLGLEP